MNIALIEFNPFHDECLYAQLAFIKSKPGNKAFLVYNHNLRSRINYWDKLDDSLPISSNQWGLGYLRILKFLNKHKIDTVIFNSLHESQVSSLIRFSKKGKRRFYGIIHDLKNLEQKHTRVLQNNLSGHFLLNDYLLQRVETYAYSQNDFGVFYPIFFPEFDPVPINKTKDEIWVTIPGLLQEGRRDYRKLLASFARGELKENIRLIFLGSSTFVNGKKEKIREDFEQVDASNQCLFWDGFVDLATFTTYIRNSDYLLPLLHPGQENMRYFDKITGLFNLAFGYNKQLIMENVFSQFADFKSSAIFYSEQEDLISILNNLEKPDIGRNTYPEAKFEFANQADNYLNFLSRELN